MSVIDVISTPLREGRRSAVGRQPAVGLFQSTPLREGRQELIQMIHSVQCFNPRPSVRGDAHAAVGENAGRISIHAPP